VSLEKNLVYASLTAAVVAASAGVPLAAPEPLAAGVDPPVGAGWLCVVWPLLTPVLCVGVLELLQALSPIAVAAARNGSSRGSRHSLADRIRGPRSWAFSVLSSMNSAAC
jgi:hypothetical protein